MKHPHMLERERRECFEKRCSLCWYRWISLYSLALVAVVGLIYAVHHEAHAALVSMVAGLFVAGILITAWLARQRACAEMDGHTDAGRRRPPAA